MSGPANTQFSVAVHALMALTVRRDEPTCSDWIASSAGVNAVYVRKILGRLRVAGMVESKSGVNGGWFLLSDPEVTTLADIWEVVSCDSSSVSIHDATKECPIGVLAMNKLRAVESSIDQAVKTQLEGVSLASLVLE